MPTGYTARGVDVEWWMKEIRKGIAYRKKMAHEDRWNTWRQYYRGRWKPGILPVNLFFRMVRTTVPRVYFRNPSISVIASKPGLEQLALSQLVERVDNKLIRTMRMKNAIKDMVQNAFMFGTGPGKLGFGSQYALRPEDFGSTSVQTSKRNTAERIEYNSNIRDDSPWFAPVHPGNFIVPEQTRRFSESRWSAVWIRRPVDDVRSDPRFKHGSNIEPSKGRSTFSDLTPNIFGEQDDMVDLIEIRDTKMRKAIVIAPFTNQKELLITEDTMQVGQGVPNYCLVFNEDDESMWGVPDSIILEPQQIELNEIRTLEMKHRRMTLLKLLYKKGAISADNLEKMLNGDVLAGVEVTGELSDIDTVQVGDIPQSLFMAGNEVINDVRENLGFSRNQTGNFAEGSADRTATEAQIVAQAAEIRVDERRDMVADLIVDVMYDTNRIIFDKWQHEMVELVMGPEAVPVWVAFQPKMLKAAEYELSIDPDSSLPQTKEAREQKAHALYERFKTNPLINPFLLTKFLLHETQGVVWDHMMQVAAMSRPGQPGSTIDQPMDARQFMDSVLRSGQAPVQ